MIIRKIDCYIGFCLICIFFPSHPGTHLPNGVISASRSKFDNKIEPSSAKMYFHYYGQLLHQQNMLQDYVRTGYIAELCFIVPFDFLLQSHFEFL